MLVSFRDIYVVIMIKQNVHAHLGCFNASMKIIILRVLPFLDPRPHALLFYDGLCPNYFVKAPVPITF